MNPFQSLIGQAIANGVLEETIVLLLLFPLVASLVAAARHLIGFRGFGILIPTVTAMALAAMGIVEGFFLFLMVLFLAILGRRVLQKLRLHYLPRMALLIWVVILGILAMILWGSSLGIQSLTALSVSPIIFLVLLAEEFIEVEAGKSPQEAIRLTVETMIMALVGYFVFRFPPLQKWALKFPLWIFLLPVVINISVGRFTGLRLIEYWRFRKLLK